VNGFLVVDKPAGMTSHDVIARLRRVLGTKRIGHAGTLDPSATGVLLIGVGRATRLLRFVEALRKEYRAVVAFGAQTTSHDADGTVVATHDASALTREEVEAALAKFRGEIEQIPPMVSAVKVGGERLYEKARRGEEVERAPRRVTVYAAEIESFEPGAQPRATIRIECSKGTYIRTIAADLGAALGTGAHLAGLRRLRVGRFGEDAAIPLDDVRAGALREMHEAVGEYPRRAVSADEALAVVHGKELPAAGIEGPYAVWGPGGLVAMAEDDGGVSRSLCVVTTV
jgi:tRNA pseudouridine55 synthase